MISTNNEHLCELRNFDLILAPSAVAAAELSHTLAHSSKEGSFGTSITTFSGWVDTLWELFGDGRSFVDDIQRLLVLNSVLRATTSNDGLAITPKLAETAARSLRSFSGLPAYDELLLRVSNEGSRAHLAPAERELVHTFAAYEKKLQELGLVERTRATVALAKEAESILSRPISALLVGDQPLKEEERILVDALKAQGRFTLERMSTELKPIDVLTQQEIEAASPTLDLRFAFPAGEYATSTVVLEHIEKFSPNQKRPFVIGCKNPAVLFELLAPALQAQDISVSAQSQTLLAATDVGKAFLGIYHALYDSEDSWNPALVSDALRTTLFSASLDKLWELDKRMRSNRLTELRTILDELSRKKEFAALLDLVENTNTEGISLLQECIEEIYASDPLRLSAEQAALLYITRACKEFERLEFPHAERVHVLASLLESSTCMSQVANKELLLGEQPSVQICTLSQAGLLFPESVGALMLLDLDSENYPSAKKDDAISLFLYREGIDQPEPFLARQRRLFAAALKAPQELLVLSRCLNDEKGNPRYPSVLLEEFVDCYRNDTSKTDDIDNPMSLPDDLAGLAVVQGEEELLQDLAPGTQAYTLLEALPSMDTNKARQLVACPKSSSSEEASSDVIPLLSPSQIETYLLCPKLWLSTRRIASNGIDEAFGPSEQGNYRHDVLMEFYQRYQEQCGLKLLPDSLEKAKTIMKEACGTVKERYQDSIRGRLVAVSKSEHHRLDEIDKELLLWLRNEVEFLPHTAGPQHEVNFSPKAFELTIDEFDIEYAGAKLTGRIDRVDVDTKLKRALVIDYKGRLDANYSQAVSKDGSLVLDTNKKIQGLIYASAIEKSPQLKEALGLPCDARPATAGALYMSYLAGARVRGVFSSDVLSRDDHLPTMPVKARGICDEAYLEALDELEACVRMLVVDPIRRGETPPKPSKKVCKWCPVSGCTQRSQQ